MHLKNFVQFIVSSLLQFVILQISKENRFLKQYGKTQIKWITLDFNTSNFRNINHNKNPRRQSTVAVNPQIIRADNSLSGRMPKPRKKIITTKMRIRSFRKQSHLKTTKKIGCGDIRERYRILPIRRRFWGRVLARSKEKRIMHLSDTAHRLFFRGRIRHVRTRRGESATEEGEIKGTIWDYSLAESQ